MNTAAFRASFSRILSLLLVLLFAFIPFASTESFLRGYSDESGYVYVQLGQYPQTAEGELQPILWRVLATDDQKSILLSEYILFARCVNASLLDYRDEFKGDFGKTDLCAYLNREFAAAAFTEAELSMLLPLENFGKVFLPSANDLENKDYGLGVTHKGVRNTKKILNEPGLRAWGTEWAIKNNGYDPAIYTNPKEKLVGSSKKKMPLKELRLFVYSGNWANHSPYWTRDPSSADGRQARDIKSNGAIGRLEVGRDNVGVRPMLHLAQGSYRIVSGTGSAENPFVLEPLAE